MTTRITIRKPDDWHLHVRDGAMLKAVLPYTARHFGRAILMPNLIPPVTTTKDGIAYRERVLAALPKGSILKPLITCYLTDDTDPDDVERRLQLISLHPPKWAKYIPEPFAQAYWELMPIHEKMRSQDFLTTRNYLRVTMCNIHDEFSKRVDAPAVNQSLLAA